MNMSAKPKAGMLALTLLSLAGLPGPGTGVAWASPPPVPPVQSPPLDLRLAQGSGREVSREQAAALVQQRFNARVLRVNVVEEGGRRVYVVQILSDGTRVSFVRVDASTGVISRD
jgi:hypothetical protein